jgi:hypothetical protein
LFNPEYSAREFLPEILRRLEGIGPDRFQAPDRDMPRNGLFLGFATDYQRALVTLLEETDQEHSNLHEAIGLPPGAHAGLPFEHRTLHTIINVCEQLLYEDLTNTFRGLGANRVHIDRDWKVYCLESTSFGRLRDLWSRFF